MAEDVEIDIIANDRGTPAWKAQADAVHAYLDELAKLDATQRANERSANDYDRAAKKAIEEGLTPLERYQRRVGELKGLLDKNKLSQDQYNRSVRIAKDEFDKVTTSTGGWATKLMSLTPAGLGLLAIRAVIRQIYDEFNNLKEVQKAAADKQITLAGAQREAIANLSEDMSVDQMNSRVKEISTRTGASQSSVMKATSAALSFKGASTADEAMDAVSVAAEQNPDNEQAQAETTKAILLLGQKNKGKSAKDLAGFLIAAKRASPTVTDQAFAQNIAPQIANAGSTGTSARQAAAVLATIGSSIGDDEGRITATTFVDLQKQLAEALPKQKGGTIGRLNALQDPKNAKIKSKLLGVFGDKGKSAEKAELHGEAKSFFTMVDLIKGGNSTTGLLRENLQKMPEIEEGGEIFDKTQSRVNAQPIQQNAALRRTMKQAEEAMQLNNVVGARGAITREGLQEILKASGASKLSQDMVGTHFEVATNSGQKDPMEFMTKRMRTSADNLEMPQIENPGDEAGMSRHEPTEEDRHLANELRTLAAALEKVVEIQKAAMEEQKREHEERKKNSTGGPQQVEVVNQQPTKFAPKADPTPAGRRPAAALGG